MVLQAYGEFVAGAIDDDERAAIVQGACPGPGACGGMYTANTMASAIECLGMSLPYSSSSPAFVEQKYSECKAAGAALLRLLELDIKPRDIMTKEAFENAVTMVWTLRNFVSNLADCMIPMRFSGHGDRWLYKCHNSSYCDGPCCRCTLNIGRFPTHIRQDAIYL